MPRNPSICVAALRSSAPPPGPRAIDDNYFNQCLADCNAQTYGNVAWHNRTATVYGFAIGDPELRGGINRVKVTLCIVVDGSTLCHDSEHLIKD